MKSFRMQIRKVLAQPCHLDLRPILIPHRVGNGARKTWVRLAKILALFESGRTFNATDLARAAGTCKKTAHRDIQFLKENGVPIEFDYHGNIFRLADHGGKQ